MDAPKSYAPVNSNFVFKFKTSLTLCPEQLSKSEFSKFAVILHSK